MISWSREPISRALSKGEVHVWAWTLHDGEPDQTDLSLLDESERQRCRRFYFVGDQARFAVCHANMRRILAGYLDLTPVAVRYQIAEYGKPALASDMRSDIRFNLSHCKSLAALAIARGIEVGVDVEDVRPIEPAVAESHFSPRELLDLSTLEGAGWTNGFYRCWTRKEAILKAEGAGLRVRLDAFDVSVLPNDSAELLEARPNAKLTREWQLVHLDPADGVMGALAHDAPDAIRLTCAEWRGSE